MIEKEIFGILSVLLALTRFSTYFWSIFRGTTRPHLFSWLIWAILMLVAGYAQHVDGAGAGAWATVFAGFACLSVAIISIWKGEKNITRSDWMYLIAALAAIPAWYFTDNPLWAVIIVSLIDICAFMPTFRKTWVNPYTEPPFSQSLAALRGFLSILAISNYSVITLMYPLLLVVLDTSLVLIIVLRRKFIPAF
ncbi:MAG: hypothetical protein GC136_04830 [Alphaproteobacteria bacterium]|nr:hypothetical protein [Alphaproteobacteria bacterium]